MADPYDSAVAVHWKVSIDGNPIGSWTTCDGPSIEVETEDRMEGGNNQFVHKLPTRLKYTNVKLSRPINADTQKLLKWITDMATEVRRSTILIEAVSPDKAETIAKWTLLDGFIARWNGPSMSVESPKPMMETIEIAYHGLMD